VAHKFFIDTVFEKGPKSWFLNARAIFQHAREFEEFKKQIKERYGDAISKKDIVILADPAGLLKTGPESIGRVFYDPRKKILVEVVRNPMDPNGILLAPVEPLRK